MWWLTCLAMLTSPLMYACQDTPSDQEYELALQDAAAEVLAKYSEDVPRTYSRPSFQMPENFMRSFRPGTGVGNREELIIDGIHPLNVYWELEFSRFFYKRFNNTDYIVGISSSTVILNKMNHDSTGDYLMLSIDDALFKSEDSTVTVKDVEFITRFTKNSEVLYVAVLVETMKTAIIYVYPIVGDRRMWVVVIEMNIHPATSSKSVDKMSYVQSSHGGSLVVLVNTLNEVKLSYKRQTSGEWISYIEVNYPSAVDLVTFTVQGHGYIAVANGQFCDIFKLDEYAQSHVLFHRIGPLTNIADLEYFRVGFHHFLAIADSNGQKLYTWNRGEFSFKQGISVPGVLQIYAASVESCRDEVILLLIKETGNVDLYAFNGEKEIFKRTNAVIPDGFLASPGSMTSLSYRNKVEILFMSTSYEARSFVIETSLKPLKDALLLESKRVSDVMKDIQSILGRQTEEIKRIKEILESAVRSNGNQNIAGVQHIRDISSTTGAVVETVNEFVLQWEDSELSLEDYRQGAKDLETDIQNLENLVKNIETDIKDVVREDEYAVITGHKKFSGHVLADTLMTTSINIEKVAGMNLAQIQKDVYRLDKPQQINGTLTFTEPLTILGNLDVGSTVNGIDISEEVMTTNGNQKSYAQMNFMNKLVIAGNLDLHGKINDIDVSEEVVTLTGTHHVGSMEFLNGIQAENVQTILLDGVRIDDLYKRAMTVSGKQRITADSTFSSIATDNIILKGRLNGYDVRELAENIVRTDKPTTITGYKTFANDVTIDGKLTVKGTVNGLRIPDDLFLTDVNQNVTGRKEFLGQVTVSRVNVLGKVDGVSIPRNIVTLSADEEISSTLYFDDGIVAQQNIVVEGLVDGVDISEIAKEAVILNETNRFTHAIFMGPVTVTGDLEANGLVNTVNLKDLVKDIVYKDEVPIEINSRKKFTKVTAGQVKLDHSINGYNIEVDFMRVHGDQIINGTKRFNQEVNFTSIYVDDGMIGDLNVTDLYRQRITLAVDEDSEIDNEIEFVDRVIVNGNLNVHGTINGLNIPNDVVLKNSNKDISNKYFEDKVIVDNLIVDGNINVDTFGGRNLTAFFNDRITLSTEQEIPGDVWISDSTADKISISGLVNGVNITDFAKNVMSKTKPQIVTAAKEFSGNVSVQGPITTGEGVNGLNLSDVKRRAFKLLEDNIVMAPLEFEENVSINKLIVSGDINGVNITRLTEDSLKKSGLQHIDGDVVFNSGFHVIGDILATNVNGLVIADDVLLKSPPQEISGQFTFGSVGVAGDLSINGTINGLDLSEIAPKLARIDSETVIESNITFTRPIHVRDNIEVTGKVNEIDLKKVLDTVLRKTGDQIITGKKVFRGNVTITGDIDVVSINGINWKEFLADVVWTNIPQNVSSSKTFNDDIFVEKDVFVSGLVNANLINGIDLQRFIDEAVYIDIPTNISGPIVFKNAVEVTGDMNAELINGLSLKTDVITIKCSADGRPQIITGQKTFHKLKVYGDVYADKVNSYNLQDLYEDTLLTEGNQTVTGTKVINGDVTFTKNVYPDTVNGMILSRDLVTIDTEQRIEGPVTFAGDVFVEKDLFINGLLNGVDLQNLSREAVYLSSDQVIEGSYSFQNAVVSSNVEVGGEVNGIDLKDFDKKVTEFFANTTDTLGFIDRYTSDHCDIAKYLQETLQNTYYSLDRFEIYQDLEFPASFIEVRTDQDIALLFLDDTATMATSVQNVWDSKTKKFNVANSSTSYIVKCDSYSIGSIDILINIGINSKDSSVIIQNSPANVPSGFIDASVVVKKQEAVIALLFAAKGTCETYLVKEYAENQYTTKLHSSLVVGKEATSIAMFEMSDVLYLAVAVSYPAPYAREFSKMYANENGDWQRKQIIPTSSSFVKHLVYQGYHYLAFANNAPVSYTKEPKSIQIYRNSGPNEQKFSLFQKVPFDDVRGMEVFRFGDLSQLHLVAWNETRIQIFGLEGESGMRNFFSIHGTCVKDVKPLLVDKDFYLVVGQQNLKTSDPVRSVLYKGLTKGFKYEAYDMEYC